MELRCSIKENLLDILQQKQKCMNILVKTHFMIKPGISPVYIASDFVGGISFLYEILQIGKTMKCRR